MTTCCSLHATVLQAMEDLDWAPEFGLLEGLMDSYDKDFGRGTYRKEPDYTTGACHFFNGSSRFQSLRE